MPRFERFTFLVNPEERQMIALLAEKLRRSQSDAVRFVVFQSVRQFIADEQQRQMHSINRSKPVSQEVPH